MSCSLDEKRRLEREAAIDEKAKKDLERLLLRRGEKECIPGYKCRGRLCAISNLCFEQSSEDEM
jgi:hypothetical protein